MTDSDLIILSSDDEDEVIEIINVATTANKKLNLNVKFDEDENNMEEAKEDIIELEIIPIKDTDMDLEEGESQAEKKKGHSESQLSQTSGASSVEILTQIIADCQPICEIPLEENNQREMEDASSDNTTLSSNSSASSPKPKQDLREFLDVIKSNLSKGNFRKAKKKLNTAFDQQNLKFEDREKMDLSVLIRQMKNLVKNDKTKIETGVNGILAEMRKHKKLQETEEEKKKKRVETLECYLDELGKLITQYDKKDINFDDPKYQEKNTSYLIKTRLTNLYMEQWEKLCEINDTGTQTDRPIFKKVDLSNVTNYPEINTAVENYMNSKQTLFAPDYIDVLKLVQKTNLEEKLSLSDYVVKEAARDIFQVSIVKLKSRRNKDLKIAFDFNFVDKNKKDPADTDPNLAKKLEANKKFWNELENITEEYAKKEAELNLKPEEYNSDSDLSDTENDSDDSDLKFLIAEYPPNTDLDVFVSGESESDDDHNTDEELENEEEDESEDETNQAGDEDENNDEAAEDASTPSTSSKNKRKRSESSEDEEEEELQTTEESDPEPEDEKSPEEKKSKTD